MYTRANVLVVGGGVGGLCTAIHLRRNFCLDVVVVSKPLSRKTIDEVVPPIFRSELANIGISKAEISSFSIASSGVTALWGQSEATEWDYIFDPYGSGLHLSKENFVTFLKDYALAQGVQIIENFGNVLPRYVKEHRWRIELGDERKTEMVIEADFFVNACGRTKKFEKLTGKSIKLDNLIACYRYFDISCESQLSCSRLFIESSKNGWWYSATLPNGRLIVTYLTDADLLKMHPAKQFDCLLDTTEVIKLRTDGASPSSQVMVSVAHSGITKRSTGDSSLTVGDASFTTDPIKGNGSLQAMKQARIAAKSIFEYYSGNFHSISDYNNHLFCEYLDYLKNWGRHYMIETRWQNSLFWKRRFMFEKNILNIEKSYLQNPI